MRVAFAIMDPLGGGAYYRGHLPARVLRAQGHEVVVGDVVRFGDTEWRLGIDLLEGQVSNPQRCRGIEFVDDAGTRGEVFVPDVLVLTAGWALGVQEILEVGRQAGGGAQGRNVSQTIVVDYDDGLEAPRDNAGFRTDQVQRKLASALSADRLTCSTPNVARDLALIDRPTRVLRNMIDLSLYDDARRQNEGRLAVDWSSSGSGRGMVLGYRGPLPWHRPDVEALRGAAGSLVDLGCRFVHIGARGTDRTHFAEVLGVPADLVEMRAQVPFALYPDQLAGIDVGLVPFARRSWSGYKSNIGALEWNAAGVPWIAGDQPEYRKLFSSSVTVGGTGWGRLVAALMPGEARTAMLARQLARTVQADVQRHEDDPAWATALGLV